MNKFEMDKIKLNNFFIVRKADFLESSSDYNVMDCANYGICCLSGACCNNKVIAKG